VGLLEVCCRGSRGLIHPAGAIAKARVMQRGLKGMGGEGSIDRAFRDEALQALLTAAVAEAAAATLAIARAGFTVHLKADRSPLTAADERSHAILIAAAARLMPGVPVVSEEMAVRPSQLGALFVLIDPLDGTKEYVAGSSEYTVNLAIVQDGAPAFGLVAVPAQGLIYRGAVGRGAERLAMSADGTLQSSPGSAQPIRVRTPPADGLVAAVSRSHLDAATIALLNRLSVTDRVACGSALKFCRVAEGIADIYPRLGTTCEWDVAAGHALVVAAGGTVTAPDGTTLGYGNVAGDFRVPAFIARGARAAGSGDVAAR
jgi:3'(2'), 5'-bisphosphate nucleotidase